MILIAYDGSDDAKSAVAQAAKLFPGEQATVLTIWEPFAEVVARTSFGLSLAPGVVETQELDRAYEGRARELAQEGTELAKTVGLDAQPSARTRRATTADAILSEGDQLDADVIAMGTRGLSGIKSLVLGSTSGGVLNRANRPVLVIPPPDVVRERSSDAD